MSVRFDSHLGEPGEIAALLDSALPRSARLKVAQDADGIIAVADVGPGAVLSDLRINTSYAELEQRVGRRHQSSEARLSVSVVPSGSCRLLGRGIDESGRGLRLLDLTSEFSITYTGASRSISFDAPVEFVGLSVDAVRAAVERIHQSPLHDLVNRHLIDLADNADRLDPGTLTTAGAGTGTLIEALIQSVSPRELERKKAVAMSLPVQIEEYVRQHLREPDLTPERIAHELHISLRYLYVLLKNKNESPAEWILRQRLAAVKEELTIGVVSIGSVAQAWGFRSHTHFTRRFKNEYGVTPSDYMQQHRRASI